MAELQTGKISQVIGPVVDVDFPPGQLPPLLTALKLTNPAISKEADNLGEFFAKFGTHLPKEMDRQRQELVKRLG